MTERNALRLDKFPKLPYAIKKNLLYRQDGRRVGIFYVKDLSPCDLVRMVDCFGDIFLLEVIDPIKKLVWIRQFPPAGEMENWEDRTNWGICEIDNIIEQGEDCRFFSGSLIGRINDPRIIRIMEERKKRLPDY